jgi:hypothetical protein
MESRAHYLAVLGLGPDASNEDATTAYKDLVKVWHPDRFQNDDRLRRRAEEQTKKINEAISKVKKLPKDQPRAGNPKKGASSRSSPYQDGSTDTFDTFSRAKGPSGFAKNMFEISPLAIKQRIGASLLRISLAALACTAAISSLRTEPNSALESSSAMAIAFFSTNMALTNLAILLRRPEMVRVDKFGMFVFGLGRLFWPDIQGVWAGQAARTTYLALNFTPEYVRRQHVGVRALYWLRSKLSRSHTAVSFAGFNSDAIQVVNAINLRHQTGHISIPNTRVSPSSGLFWCNLVSVLCPLMVIVRCFAQDTLEVTDYLPYAGLFLACRLYAVAKLAIFSKPSSIS